jgi:hypothetical protein
MLECLYSPIDRVRAWLERKYQLHEKMLRDEAWKKNRTETALRRGVVGTSNQADSAWEVEGEGSW